MTTAHLTYAYSSLMPMLSLDDFNVCTKSAWIVDPTTFIGKNLMIKKKKKQQSLQYEKTKTLQHTRRNKKLTKFYVFLIDTFYIFECVLFFLTTYNILLLLPTIIKSDCIFT